MSNFVLITRVFSLHRTFFYSIQVYSSQEYTEKGVLAIVCKSRVSTLLKIDEQECPTQQSMVNWILHWNLWVRGTSMLPYFASSIRLQSFTKGIHGILEWREIGFFKILEWNGIELKLKGRPLVWTELSYKHIWKHTDFGKLLWIACINSRRNSMCC